MPCSHHTGPPTSRGAPRCQVPSCNANLSSLRAYYLRYHICEQHSKADEVLCEGEPCRFCQLCGRFHPLAAFNSGRRSCKERLAKHNARRKTLLLRKANSVDGSYSPSAKGKKGQRRRRQAKATDTDVYDSDTDREIAPTMSGSCDQSFAARGCCREDASDSATLGQQLNLRSLAVPCAAAEVYLAAYRPYVPPQLSRAVPLPASTHKPVGQVAFGSRSTVLASAMPSLLDLDSNTVHNTLQFKQDYCTSHAHISIDQQQQQTIPSNCLPDACDNQATSPSQTPQPKSTCSGRSQQSASSVGHANSACSSAKTEASDMDTECGEPGLLALWRQWGGDDCNLIEPTISNIMALNLSPSNAYRSLTCCQSLL